MIHESPPDKTELKEKNAKKRDVRLLEKKNLAEELKLRNGYPPSGEAASLVSKVY